MLRFLLQSLLILVVFFASWRFGGKPERHIASIYFSMLVLSTFNALVVSETGGADYSDLQNVHFALDLGALLGVVFTALRYDRWWVLWVGSVQFIAVTAHLLRALAFPMPPIAYAVMERWPVWLAILITGFGTFLHHRNAMVTGSGK